MLAVSGRSWDLCWRSWAALGAYVRDLGASVGGLGPLLGLMLAVLAGLGASVGGPGGPGAEKWPKPEREQWSQKGQEAEPSEAHRSPPNHPFVRTNFFCRYSPLKGGPY